MVFHWDRVWSYDGMRLKEVVEGVLHAVMIKLSKNLKIFENFYKEFESKRFPLQQF